MTTLDLGLIGNSTIAALVDPRAHIVWACLPRFDGEPVFDALLRDADDASGRFAIELIGYSHGEQHYLKNTAVLVTRLYTDDGACVEVTDFAPRFKQYGRTFRPVMLVRQVRRIAGTPRIRVVLKPQAAHGASPLGITHGSNHIRYVLPDQVLRLTTDASLSAVLEELPFVMDGPLTFILGPDETCPEAVTALAERFREQTCDYWSEWVRYLGIPFE
ncbi:MAG: glycoside hydrolase family 15 protein, partial [Gammaproteobacteria bacterium]|nr:glycoside hydrolase family 15 protein [Gammaproteobacteria bacterium]